MYETISMRRIKSAKKSAWTRFANSGFIGEPFAISIIKKRSLPPSRAGIGRMLMIARFIEIRAMN